MNTVRNAQPTSGPAGQQTALVIAVDGPSGSGKSTISRRVASALGVRYLDTGAMYRALTWWILNQGVDPSDAAAVVAAAADLPLSMGTDPEHPTIHVGEHDVSAAIRGPEVTAAVSVVSAVPELRTMLVGKQRELIGAGGIVVEGRDIGTTVAPAAQVKIFLTASAAVRSLRRTLEHSAPGTKLANAQLAQTQTDLERRDHLDSTRAVSPLAMADDAVALDTSAMGIEEVVAAVLTCVAKANDLANDHASDSDA